MEQRKVYLNCGPVHMYPVAASVGLVVTPFAIEITTIIQFANIPKNYCPWLFHYPVQTANGHLVQCGIFHNAKQYVPAVMFDEQTQTVTMGPCVPQQHTLVFTLVNVYVPSFQQTFLAHLHLGVSFFPCVTSIKVRNLVTRKLEHISAQVRSFSGEILALLKPDGLDTEWVSTQLMLHEPVNAKIHIYLMEDICFGINDVYWGYQNNQYWALLPEKSVKNRASNLSLWILKPRVHDIQYLRFYAANVGSAPKIRLQFEDLVVTAARIISRRDCFFNDTQCVTADSENGDTLALLGEKVAALDLPDYRNPSKINPELLDCVSNKAEWTWRTELPLTPHICRMMAPLGL